MKYSPLLLALILLLLACQKHHDSPGSTVSDLGKPYTLPTTSQANPAYDAASGGIYKAIDMTDRDVKTIAFSLANTANATYALEYENGVLRDSLIRYVLMMGYPLALLPLRINDSAIDPNKSIFTYLESYRPDSANVHAFLNVNADGSSPNFRDDYASASAVLKERSDDQVFCYAGSYQGKYQTLNNGVDSGRIAFVLNADTAIAVQLNTVLFQYYTPGGARITNGQFTITTSAPTGDTFTLDGTISGNTVSGTWKGTLGLGTGDFTAQRTL